MGANEDTTQFDAHSIERGATPDARQPCLVQLVGDKPGALLCLSSLRYVVGRSEDCHMQVEVAGVSRNHCELVRTPMGYEIRDLDSTNGLFINGHQFHCRTLEDGDRIALGPNAMMAYRVYFVDETACLKNLHEASQIDLETGAMNRQNLLDWMNSELAFSRERAFHLAVLALGLTPPEPDGDEGNAREEVARLAREAVDTLNSVRKPSSPLARLGPLEFVLAHPFQRESELQTTWNRLVAELRPQVPFHGGWALAQECANLTPENLLLRALRNLRIAQVSGSEAAVR